MTGSIIAALYLRVSTKEQAEEGKESLDAQRREALAVCAANGWEPGPEYREKGASASRATLTNRPELQRLIADAQAGKFQAVAAFADTRLDRNTKGGIRLILALSDAGIRYLAVPGIMYDLEDPFGILRKVFASTISEGDAKNRAGAVKATKAGYAAQGRWAESTKLYGYGWSKELKRPVLHPEEARGVALAFRLAGEERLSCEEIARKLTATGVRAKYESGNYPGRWFAMVVTRLLAEPRYKGEGWETAPGVPVHPDWAPCRLVMEQARDEQGELLVDEAGNPVLQPKRDASDHLVTEPAPALVSSELWEQAQVTARLHRETRKPWVRRPRLFNGMVRCGRCGGPMSTREAHPRGKTYPYYYCMNSDRTPRGSRCDLPYIPAERLEERVWGYVAYCREHPEVIARMTQESEDSDRRKWEDRRKVIYGELKALRARGGKALRSHANGVYTDEEYLIVKAQQTEERALLEAEDANLAALIADEHSRGAGVEALQRAFATDRDCETREEKRLLLADLDAKVIVYGPDRFALKSPLTLLDPNQSLTAVFTSEKSTW
jgi:site-specific DNA recombinase